MPARSLPWLLLALTPASAAAGSVHRVHVDVLGAVAVVDVERSVAGGEGEERVLDLDLPEGAALLSVQATGDGETVPLRPGAGPDARGAHQEALRARGARPTSLALDEGTDLRVHVAAASAARVRYRYVAPLACRRGRFVLRVPGSLEPDPAPAEVRVSFAPGMAPLDLDVAGVPVRRPAAGSVRAPARAAWDVSFVVRPAAGRVPAQVLASATRAGAHGPAALAVALCRPEGAGPARPGPQRVLFLLDRSRSVGGAGLGAEREVVRAFLEHLPPSVRFNGVLFDRGTAALFPLSRAATAEALAAVDRETTPAHLRNGTDLPRALRALADLAARDPETPAGRTWVVLVTDGALPEALGAPALREALGAFGPAPPPFAVLVVRPRHDDPPPAAALQLLAALPGQAGGVLRSSDGSEPAAVAAEAIAALGRGGDLFEVTVGGTPFAAALAPGAGAFRAVALAGAPAGQRLAARHDGRALSAPVIAVRLPAGRLAPLLEPTPGAWAGRGRRLAALVTPGPAPAPLADEVPRGQMDRQVVRNALSLAFLPRARACYLARAVRRAGDLSLRGRIRLELHLERGELVDAVVRASTLGNPGIEECVREAAFGVEIPRPMHRDAPTVAVLNLVFQPRTPQADPGDASPLAREIDLLIGPISFPTDPGELLGDPAR